MKTSLYKLKEYKIIERDTGELSWDAHFGLGSLREGRCFKKGSILFIGPAGNERLGYLMLEYTDHLKRLPNWLKTDYYCTSIEIFHCDTGKSVSKEEMNFWEYDPRRKENMFCVSSIKTMMIGVAGLLLLIILLTMLFSSDHLKRYSSHWNYNKKEHPSSHRMNR